MRGAPAILGVVYDDGPFFDMFLVALVGELRATGYRLAGAAQINAERADRRKCDMIVEELASGTRVLISEDRGREARGCRLDTDALARLTRLAEQGLGTGPDLLVLNKFGKEEAEGRGLRPVIASAAERAIPAVVGVPRRNLQPFQDFCGETATVLAPRRDEVLAWIASRVTVTR